MNETRTIEHFLQGKTSEETVLLEARLLLDKNLSEKVLWQKNTYTLVQQYGRKKLEQEIAKVHGQLFTSPKHLSFRKKIMSYFK